MRSHHDLRDVILRLRHVELRAVLIVEIEHVLIGDRDLRHHFAIQQFLHRKLPADVALQVVNGKARNLSAFSEILLRCKGFSIR